MEFAASIAKLPMRHQAAFCALNCEKMLLSVAKFDTYEAFPVSNLFENATAVLYSFALDQPAAPAEYAALKDEIESRWPDLDETDNEFASYAFDAFVAISEALRFVISGETTHAANCSTAVLDTVDMYVQEIAASEPIAAELEAFIQASPFMVQEMTRQAALLERLTETPILNTASLGQLQEINNRALLIDLDGLSYE